MIRDCDTLLEAIKRDATIPAYQPRWSDENLLALAGDFIQESILPLILNMNTELLIVSDTETVVASQRAYRIPYRAVGRVLRNLSWQADATSQPQNLDPLTPRDEANYPATTAGAPAGALFQSDKYIPIPRPSTGFFNVAYMRRQSRLIKKSDAWRIENINTGSRTLTLDTAPTVSDIATGTHIDLIRSKAGNDILAIDAVVQSVTSVQIVLTADLPTELAIGDYVALAEESPFLNLPQELGPLIAQGAKAAYASTQDPELYEIFAKERDRMIGAAPTILAPRITGSAPIIVNETGLVRNYRRGYYGGR
jgi:hypothetical protein